MNTTYKDNGGIPLVNANYKDFNSIALLSSATPRSLARSRGGEGAHTSRVYTHTFSPQRTSVDHRRSTDVHCGEKVCV